MKVNTEMLQRKIKNSGLKMRFALWTVEREFYKHCFFTYLGSCFAPANRAINP